MSEGSEVGTRLTISRVPCARLTPGSSVCEGTEGKDGGLEELHEQGFSQKERDPCLHSIRGPRSHVQLWLELQPPLPFTLAVTVLHGFLVPSWIHISPRTWR